MAQKNTVSAVQRHELEELLARVDYIDEERRKAAKQVGLLEQKVSQQETQLASREKRIKDLEARLGGERVAGGDHAVSCQHFRPALRLPALGA